MIAGGEDKVVGTLAEVASWLASRREEIRAHGKDEPIFEAKVRKRKRTLTQNAYYWVMLGELASCLGMGNAEVHRMMIRSYGPFDTFTVREDVPLAAYFRYYDEVGEGWSDGVRYVHVRAFKGSSEMDSREFSRLLNGVIEECRQQGIETMTPEEAARLRWIEGEE